MVRMAVKEVFSCDDVVTGLIDRGVGECARVATYNLQIVAETTDGQFYVYKRFWTQAGRDEEDGWACYDYRHKEEADAIVEQILAVGSINPDHWVVDNSTERWDEMVANAWADTSEGWSADSDLWS